MADIAEGSKIVRVGTEEFVAPAAKLLSEALTENPVLNYILPSGSIPTFLPKYFTTLATAASLNGGIIAQVGNWKACGILMPPGCHVDRPGALWKSGFLGMMWGVGFKGCWVSHLYNVEGADTHGPIENDERIQSPNKPSTIIPYDHSSKGLYYLYQTGTLPSARGQGFCTLILRHFQELVLSEGRNNLIWLEATTEAAMQVYRREGWAVIDELVVGKGKADKWGKDEIGGEGFTVWVMVWWPAKDYWREMGEETGVKMWEVTWMKDLKKRIEANQLNAGSERDKMMLEKRIEP